MAWKKVERITEYQMQNRFDSAFNAISGAITEDEFVTWYNDVIEPLLENPLKAMRAAESKAAEVVSWWLQPKEDSSNSKEQKKKTRGINKPERAHDATVARQGKPKGSA